MQGRTLYKEGERRLVTVSSGADDVLVGRSRYALFHDLTLARGRRRISSSGGFVK